MNLTEAAGRALHHYSPSSGHERESPKGFFRFLRSDRAYFHRLFATRLGLAGFGITGVKKRAHHDIWNARLLRGSVAPGAEVQTAKGVISAAMKHCGVNYPKREVEVAVIGNRITCAFEFHKGVPGSLVFTKGRQSWSAEEWP